MVLLQLLYLALAACIAAGSLALITRLLRLPLLLRLLPLLLLLLLLLRDDCMEEDGLLCGRQGLGGSNSDIAICFWCEGGLRVRPSSGADTAFLGRCGRLRTGSATAHAEGRRRGVQFKIAVAELSLHHWGWGRQQEGGGSFHANECGWGSLAGCIRGRGWGVSVQGFLRATCDRVQSASPNPPTLRATR